MGVWLRSAILAAKREQAPIMRSLDQEERRAPYWAMGGRLGYQVTISADVVILR